MVFTFSHGVFETTIILNSSAEDRLMKNLSTEKQLASNHHLSCITLYLPDENTEVAGYYYFILKKIA